MKKLEALWENLTEPERVTLVVLADVLTHRQAIANSKDGGPAFTTAGKVGNINRGLGSLDSTVLRPEAQIYLERFLVENPIERFDQLYQKLFAQI